MERGAYPEPERSAVDIVAEKISQALKAESLTHRDLEDPSIYARIVDPILRDLERVGGVTTDSLDLVEVIIILADEEDDRGEGGLGVREPRRPLPNSGSAEAFAEDLGIATQS